ncbi:unnamed protein product [Rhizophagus irregularis]|nr:unnamed protein product [Rhizophagus irregularis]
MQGLELDAFFQKYRIALEVQGAHSTSWYKDIKKLEDIVNHDRKKRCICLDNGIFLIEINIAKLGFSIFVFSIFTTESVVPHVSNNNDRNFTAPIWHPHFGLY